MNKEVIIKRLAIAKYLYKQGYAQSQQAESIAFTCILHFHDAVEIFLKLAAENANIKSDQFRFLQYWDEIPTLTFKESMRHLNERRVNLKHKGILPAKQDLEISRVNVGDFFEQNCKTQFGIDFADISLFNLISYLPVRNFLELAQNHLDKHELPDAIENASYAFHDLLDIYEQTKISIYHTSPFLFGERTTFWSNSLDALRELDRGLADNLNKLSSSVNAMQESIKIMSLGIDYRKFSMFKLLTPTVTKVGEKYYAELFDDKKWTKENCQFCIDFVMESSLKLQDFDFDVNHLIDNDPPVLEFISGDFDNGMTFREVPKKDD